MNVIKNVVEKDRCVGCGVCAGICPQEALTMAIAINGDLAPKLDSTKCNPECGLCMQHCPFRSGLHDPRSLNQELFSAAAGAIFEEDIGWHIKSYAGYRKDITLRNKSASGGLLTWCLEQLLVNNYVDRIAVVRRAPFGQELLFEFFGARTLEELRLSAGSVYHPVPIDSIVKEISASQGIRWAIVGVPCLCAAIRGLQNLRENVPFVLGLACGMYQNTFYTELLALKSGISPDNLGNVAYRIKRPGNRPNDYVFQAADINGNTGKDIPYLGLPYFLGKHAFFRQNACNYCKDVFAETADACFMDSWLPDYMIDYAGTSLVTLRSSLLIELFEKGNDVVLEPISPASIIMSQATHVHRKRTLIHMRLNNKSDTSMYDWLSWLGQKYMQKRSKMIWNKCRGTKSLFEFWTRTAPFLLTIKIVETSNRLVRFVRRKLRKSY